MNHRRLGAIYRLSYNADDKLVRIYFLPRKKGEVTNILWLEKIGSVKMVGGILWRVEAPIKLYEISPVETVVDKHGEGPSHCLEFSSFLEGVESHFRWYPNLEFQLKKEVKS